ncbi:MAG: ribonuclease H-like domain-containing protein [Vicinamibacterales bacterium]
MNPETLRARLRGIIQPASPLTKSQEWAPVPVEDVLGGQWRETASGRSFVVTRRYGPNSGYGDHRIGDFFDRIERSSASACLFGATQAQPPYVFFDLETTGLSGGAGTYAFLVGCARFESDGSFVTEQHLMVDYASERAMLRVVADDLARAGTLVTFNGKSFDAPVVETRYLFHRAQSPCAGLPHLDMLHPARRFWGGANADGCSLTTLESRQLGARRVGDVPGFEIPARYFQFIRSGDARPLAAVFEHNRLDLISLAGLTARLLSMAAGGAEVACDAHEALGLGRTYERAGLSVRAEQAFERAAALCGTVTSLRGLRAEALRALAVDARRHRRFDLAAERWQRVVDTPSCPPNLVREASEALAIHHEHRVRDLEAARLFTLKSLEADRGVAWGDAVRHRLARIERKISEKRSPCLSWPSLPASAARPSGSRTSS